MVDADVAVCAGCDPGLCAAVRGMLNHGLADLEVGGHPTVPGDLDRDQAYPRLPVFEATAICAGP